MKAGDKVKIGDEEWDVISAYSRAQAIEDGVLVDVTAVAPDLVQNAGIRLHVAMTNTVWGEYVEVPEGAIFKRDLYDYATILKYQVLKVHRGEVKGDTIYVGHYNPWKPRSEAADRRVKEVGGNLRQFQAGQVHRMALETPIEDHFMGGIVNKYFGQVTNTIYWAVWTNLE